MADDRTYVRIHDGMNDHPKFVRAGGDAGWLWLCGTCYSGRHQLDGKIPKEMVARLSDRKSPAKLAVLLVEVGLWIDRGDHYEIHDYLEHQRSAEEIQELKEKRRQAGSRGGQAKASRLANAKQVLEQPPQQTAGNLVSKSVPDTEVSTDIHPQTTDSCSESPAVGAEAAKAALRQSSNGKPASRSDAWADERNRSQAGNSMVSDWGQVRAMAAEGKHRWRDNEALSPVARRAASECAVTIRMENESTARVAFYEAWKRLSLEGVR
jgi:hypothetical protein